MPPMNATIRRAAAALAVAILLTAGAGSAMAQGGQTNIQLGPDFPIGAKTAAQYKGKFVVFYFWSTAQPNSVKALRDVVRLAKEYGKAEKFGGFVLVNFDTPQNGVGARNLVKDLPFEKVFDGDTGPYNANVFKVPLDKLPVASVLTPDSVVDWSDQFAKLEDHLVKVLGVEKAAAPVDADSPEQAVASLAAGMAKINDRGEFTEAIERLAGLKSDLLNDPNVFAAAAQLVLRIKAEKENKSGIDRALKANPKAKAVIAQISRRAVTLFNAPMGSDAPERTTVGGGTGPTTPPTRDELADRKLESAETLQLEGKDLEAYEQFKDLSQRYAGTDASKAAAQHVTDYEADPKFMEKYNATAGEEKAQSMLKLARSYKAAGRGDLAKKLIDELLATYPQSAAATEAKADGLDK